MDFQPASHYLEQDLLYVWYCTARSRQGNQISYMAQTFRPAIVNWRILLSWEEQHALPSAVCQNAVQLKSISYSSVETIASHKIWRLQISLQLFLQHCLRPLLPTFLKLIK